MKIFFLKVIILLKIGKIHYFLPLNIKINFPRGWYFLNAYFFLFLFMNTLLFHQKLQNLQLTDEMLTFLVADTFKSEILFLQIRCHFAENRRNLQLIVKLWTFYWGWHFFKCASFLHYMLLFCKKSAIFAIPCYYAKVTKEESFCWTSFKIPRVCHWTWIFWFAS